MSPLRPLLALLLLTTALTAGSRPAVAAAVPVGFTDSQVASVPSPTALAATPDGRLLVASQGGQIRVVKNGVLLATPALDLAGKNCTNSERGVLGVAADPDPTSRTVYVFYTARGSDATCPVAGSGPNPAGAPRNRVSRFTMTGDVIDPASEVRLLDGIYSTAGYHNAGDLHVGHDGYLYVTTGDGGCDYHGDATHAGGSGCGGDNDTSRDRNVLNGKVLRITTSGGIPTDNPFTGTGTARCNTGPAAAGTTCQEAYAVGLRNPFRFAFDPNATGTTFRIDDVGQNVWEEIDQGARGADYGWNTREGHCQRTDSESSCGSPTPAGLTDPVYDYPHSTTVGGVSCGSITGGAYVPTGVWPAAYNGSYLFSDYVCGTIFALSPGGVRTTLVSGLGSSSAVAMTFAPDVAGGGDGAGQSLYYTSYAGGGEVRRLAATGTANRAPVARVTASPTSGALPLTVTLNGSTSTDADGGSLSYSWAFGDGTAGTTTTGATTTHTYARAGAFTAILTVRDAAGASSSASVVVHPGDRAPAVRISTPTSGQQFVVGGAYTLSGTATDAEDGALPASALSWTVLRHHQTHTHPCLGPVSGNDIPLAGPAPEDLDAAASSYLEIRLSATDSAGVTTTVSRTFNPVKVPVTLASSPTGAKVTVNGVSVTGPTTVTSWQGYGLQVMVPAQNLGGRPYGFEWWSDHGTATHSYVTPASASTLTGYLAPAPSVPTAVTARQGATASATLSWSPPTAPGKSAVSGYRVTRDGVDSAGEGAYATTVAATARSFTLTRLVPGRIYTLTVAAVNAQGAGVAASVRVTVLGPGLVTAPTTVSVRPTDPGRASISWSPPAGGSPAVTGYRVSRDGTDEKGVGPYSTVLSATTQTNTLTSLVPGRTYRLTVQAVTAAGAGAPVSAEVVPSSFSTVSAPSSVSVRQPASGQATLTWNVPIIGGGKTVTGYRVSRDGTDSVGVGAYTTVVSAGTRTFTMTSLAVGQAYTLSVQAVVSTGEATPVSQAAIWTTS
ncbi:fibronectin type III domain-containing protein [uncultured Friedmanniella sp.]|uniref:fibronectin type III domain-containing protein n=1 Tax=uncultured Friedmanniella sp. TaxID=335381 RepID=UPI0035CC0B4A